MWLCLAATTVGAAALTWLVLGLLPAAVVVAVVLLLTALIRR